MSYPTEAIVYPFSAITAVNLPEVGGKGANLGEMTHAGFPVPPGFCVTTSAFRQFMAHCADVDDLYTALNSLTTDDLERAREVGRWVRESLTAVAIPPPIAAAVLAAWRAEGADLAYAVRSSATAEDLPDASFAGQQDTYLNVRGEQELLDAVRRCWVSLFTDRAILYRIQNGFAHEEVALSVVVQRMVLPEVSGILFTADPVSGNRNIASIDASYGLGEALVSGLVSADLYKVDKRTLELVDVVVADKQVAIRPLPEGGTVEEKIEGHERTAQVLTEQQAFQLAQLGQQVEAHYTLPQDIEWAIAEDTLYLLQTRPITTLYPVPTREELPERLRVFFSFASVQGVMDPITPFGQDTIKNLFAESAVMFGMTRTRANQTAMWSAGERLWVNFTTMFTHPIGRRLMLSALPLIDPGAAAAFRGLVDDPDLQPKRGWFHFRTMRMVGHLMLPLVVKLIRTLRHPNERRAEAQQALQTVLDAFKQKQTEARTLAERLDFYEEMTAHTFPVVVPKLLPVVAGGVASLKLAEKLTRGLPEDAPNVLELTRGLPHNVTTEMDLVLWQTAQAIAADVAAQTLFSEQEAPLLADLYLTNQLPDAAQTSVSDFLDQYGMRGLAEIDFGRKRWREDPTPVMQVLRSYLQITGPSKAPDAMFAHGEETAQTVIDELVTAVRQTRGGRIKSKLMAAATKRVRALAGLRESPKFFIIQMMGLARELLLQSGAELAAQGVITQPEDIFFLYQDELFQLAEGETIDCQALVTERRQLATQEQKRQLLPRVLLSDGRVFYEGVAVGDESEDQLVGSPVSPGVVEGDVHVVFDPQETQLAPRGNSCL